MRAKFLQHIIDETPFCVDYKVMKWAEKLKQNNMEKLEFKGTKGGWNYDINANKGFDVYLDKTIKTIAIVLHKDVSYMPNIIESEANAKLIAGCPIMLNYIIKQYEKGCKDAESILATLL